MMVVIEHPNSAHLSDSGPSGFAYQVMVCWRILSEAAPSCNRDRDPLADARTLPPQPPAIACHTSVSPSLILGSGVRTLVVTVQADVAACEAHELRFVLFRRAAGGTFPEVGAVAVPRLATLLAPASALAFHCSRRAPIRAVRMLDCHDLRNSDLKDP